MRHYEPMKSGDEFDALTWAKRYYRWRAGHRSGIKRRYRQRERRTLNRPDDSW